MVFIVGFDLKRFKSEKNKNIFYFCATIQQMCIQGYKASKQTLKTKAELNMKDNFKDLRKDDLLNEMRKLKDKQQNDFIDKLNCDIDWLIEKAMKKRISTDRT